MDTKGGLVCGCRRTGTTARLFRSGVKGGGLVPPWRTFRPPPFPTPGQAWGTYVVCGCCWASTTARANALMQIVPNLSSLDTLFYSVIYYSVIRIQQYGFEFCYLKWLTLYLFHTVVDFFLYKLWLTLYLVQTVFDPLFGTSCDWPFIWYILWLTLYLVPAVVDPLFGKRCCWPFTWYKLWLTLYLVQAVIDPLFGTVVDFLFGTNCGWPFIWCILWLTLYLVHTVVDPLFGAYWGWPFIWYILTLYLICTGVTLGSLSFGTFFFMFDSAVVVHTVVMLDYLHTSTTVTFDSSVWVIFRVALCCPE